MAGFQPTLYGRFWVTPEEEVLNIKGEDYLFSDVWSCIRQNRPAMHASVDTR